jgi:hypothetical protein
MKKWVLIFVLLSISLVSADSGEYYYDLGSEALANGDVANARYNFEQATIYLTGEKLEVVQGILEFLYRLESENTKALMIDNEDWYFIGEIDEEESVMHLYYDVYGNSITHTTIEGGAGVADVMSNLEGISFSSSSLNDGGEWIDGYISEYFNLVDGTTNYIQLWSCGDTTNIAYVTSAGSDAGYSVFNEGDVCPSGVSFWVYFVIIALVLGGFGYYYGRKHPFEVNLGGIEKFVKNSFEKVKGSIENLKKR